MRGRTGSAKTVVIGLTVAALVVIGAFTWMMLGYYLQIKEGKRPQAPTFSIAGAFSARPDAEDGAPKAGFDVATSDDPALGAEDPELIIVEFVDYECPFCQQVSGTVRQMASKYGDRVRFILRDFPVQELHPNAMLAAEAAGCAEEQDKFWAMHDRMFANGAPLTRGVLDRLAEQSGLDMKTYHACMNAHGRLPEIEEDLAAGQLAGAVGTPTFFFNGQRVNGAIPEALFDELIRGLLEE